MISSFTCPHCERDWKDANEITEEPTIVDGEQYCSRLCAAFALIRADVEEYGLSNDTAEFDALLDSALHEGPTVYPMKVSWNAAVNLMSDDSFPAEEWTPDERPDFSAALVIVSEDDDEGTPTHEPEHVAVQ
jgi:hypothetical protein